MQEVLNLVKVIKTDIANLSKKVEEMSKTHAQQLNEEWIQRDQVMRILKISERKLQSMRDNGTLPFSQIDGKIYYRTSDVEKLLNSNYSNS
ncbi:helix-turn-helix domain-containing protein [uncultured Draconibacterium sp.]|uniref:helix-turn-helix domain-containing protein n=1 Tax=uncultured Draconibacterium sp. TaxID=1573823 RepID=UPI0029C7EAB8|nr:helix-turn-helix domain-containing protein [uncultured Draconibacterium sp.]